MGAREKAGLGILSKPWPGVGGMESGGSASRDWDGVGLGGGRRLGLPSSVMAEHLH